MCCCKNIAPKPLHPYSTCKDSATPKWKALWVIKPETSYVIVACTVATACLLSSAGYTSNSTTILFWGELNLCRGSKTNPISARFNSITAGFPNLMAFRKSFTETFLGRSSESNCDLFFDPHEQNYDWMGKIALWYEQPRFTTKDFHTIMRFCEGWGVNE